jgi:hypothetical protein
MSFVITIYVPEAIVMASDSRQFITIKRKDIKNGEQNYVQTVNSDFVYKTFLLEKFRLGISTFGDSMLNGTSFESHIRRFEEKNSRGNQTIKTTAEQLLKYFRGNFPGINTNFHVAGFIKESGISIPHVYSCHTRQNGLTRINISHENEKVINGCLWGGQVDVINALMGPLQLNNSVKDNIAHQVRMPIIWDAMSVQDAIDFAIYAVKTTIDTIRFQARPKNVGGPIDVLLLTPESATWIQRKQFSGSTLAAGAGRQG